MIMGLNTVMIARPIASNRLLCNRRWAGLLGTIATFMFLAACAAVGALETNDPAKKLNDARLLLRDNRPLPAERLIGESIDIYQSKGDRGGLADAQYLYAVFLAGDAVKLLKGWYRENGFRDSSITFDKKREGAARYFQLAASGFTVVGKFADATNAYFDLGLILANNGNHASACRSFSESLKNYYTYLRWDPAPEVRPPKGYHSYEELVITIAAAAGCPKAQSADKRDIGDERVDRELALAEDAHDLARNILGPTHHAAIPGMKFLAARYEDRYRFDDAEKTLRTALKLSRKPPGNDNDNTLELMLDLTRFHFARRQPAKAEALASETFSLRKRTLGEDSRDTLESMADLAMAIELQRRPDEAERIYRRALELSDQAWGKTDSDTLRRMRDVAALLHREGRYNEAEPIYLELIELSVETLGKKDVNTILRNNELVSLYQDQGRIAEASELRERSLAWQRMDFPK